MAGAAVSIVLWVRCCKRFSAHIERDTYEDEGALIEVKQQSVFDDWDTNPTHDLGKSKRSYIVSVTPPLRQ